MLKATVCEICNNSDLIKQDGFFVCRYCGTKYSLEEAKNLLVDVVVEESGSVRIDTSVKLDKAMKNAHRARDDGNFDLAFTFYKEVLDIDPDNWAGIFYTTYLFLIRSSSGQIQTSAISMSNCNTSVIALIKSKVNETDEKKSAVLEVIYRTIYLSDSFHLEALREIELLHKLKIRDKRVQSYKKRMLEVCRTLYSLGEQVQEAFADLEEIKKLAVIAWKKGIEIDCKIYYLIDGRKSHNRKRLYVYANAIRKYETNYRLPG